MKKPKLKLPVKAIATWLGILLVFVFASSYIWGAVKSWDYFKVKEIICKEGERAKELSYLKGRNIFDIDLAAESRYILDYYPDSSGVKLARLLPDRLFVDFIKRRPVALIKLYRYFSVDAGGVIFYLAEQSNNPGLPVVLGLETQIFGPKPGKKYNIRELNLALNIINEMKKSRAGRQLQIRKIDVTSYSNAVMAVGWGMQNIEVRLGPDSLKDKVNLLTSLIAQAKNELTNIAYIDLRFKEPAIKLKNVETK